MILYLAFSWGVILGSRLLKRVLWNSVNWKQTDVGHRAIINVKGINIINCIEKLSYCSDLLKFSESNIKKCHLGFETCWAEFLRGAALHHYKTLACPAVTIKWWPVKATLIEVVCFTDYEGHYRKLHVCGKAAQRCHLAVTLRNVLVFCSSFFRDTAVKCRRKEGFYILIPVSIAGFLTNI